MRRILLARPESHRPWARFNREVSRIEGLSDAAFGFLLTLLVSSQQAPQKFEDLQAIMSGMPAFAVSFAFLIFLWFAHYQFFRRYALEDMTTVVLNSVLLFVCLVTIYPMKFMMSWVVGVASRRDLPRKNSAGFDDYTTIKHVQIPQALSYYAGSVVLIGLIFALLYGHAWRHRKNLKLSELEGLETQISIYDFATMAWTGLMAWISFQALATNRSPILFLGILALSVLPTFPRKNMIKRRDRLKEKVYIQSTVDGTSNGV
jgi:uncharacterized membrane protein